MILQIIFLSFVTLVIAQSEENDKSIGLKSLYSVEGKVTSPDPEISQLFYQNTRIIVNYGEFLGFIRYVTTIG